MLSYSLIKPRTLFFVCTSLVMGLYGCGDDNQHQHSIQTVCDKSTATIPFEIGMTLESEDGNFKITVLATEVAGSAPNTIDRGLNTWTVSLTDAHDSPITNGTIILTPTMPGHGHGTYPPNFESTNNGTANYQLGPFDLLMPGTWLLTFKISTPGNNDVQISAGYCIES